MKKVQEPERRPIDSIDLFHNIKLGYERWKADPETYDADTILDDLSCIIDETLTAYVGSDENFKVCIDELRTALDVNRKQNERLNRVISDYISKTSTLENELRRMDGYYV